MVTHKEVYRKESVSFRTCHTQREEEESTVFVSDASDKFAFVFEADKLRIVEEFSYSEEERGMGSGHRGNHSGSYLEAKDH